MIQGAFENIREGRISGLLLSHVIYPRQCIERNVEAFKTTCEISIRNTGNATILSLNVLPEHSAQGRELAWRFVTAMLREASEMHVLE